MQYSQFETSFYDKPILQQYQHDDLCDNASEMLVRTNPKLSTNVKLMTDGSFVMLESFNACKEISGSRFKNFKTYSKSTYNSDLMKFWKNIDSSFAYSMFQEHDDFSVKTTYDKQYETFYWSGCEYVDSLQYEQSYGLLAPLWLNDKIPDRFIIFKIKEPSYWEYLDSQKQELRELDFVNDILNKCEIIKTFDLTESSKLGSYIRRYYNQSGFPESPLTFSNDGISFNGISYSTGEFTSIKENCGDRMWRHDDAVLEFDEYITSGFERNGIVVANLLNIEFLFDDNSETYTFSRYFGLYCDLIKDDEIKIDKNGLYNLTNIYDFNMIDFDVYHTQQFNTHNQDGVIIPFDTAMFFQSQGHPLASNYTDIVSKLNSIFCIEDIHNNLHSINRNIAGPANTIRLTDTDVDLDIFKGFVEHVDSVTCTYEDTKTPSSLRFKVLSQIPALTKIKLYQNFAQIGDALEAGNYNIGDPNDPDNLPFEYAEGEYALFCCDGTANQIAEAIAKAFNKTYNVGINAYYCEDCVHLVSTNPSLAFNDFNIVIELQDPSLDVNDYIEFPNGTYLSGSSFYAHLKCNEDVVDKFLIGDYIPSRAHNGYSKIISIVLDYDNSRMNGEKLEFPNGMMYDILLDSDGVYASKTNTTKIYKLFNPSLYRLSFYPVKDFEMSTYHDVTKYGDLGELKYETEWLSSFLKSQLNSAMLTENNISAQNLQLGFQIDSQNIIVNIESLGDLFLNPNPDLTDLVLTGPNANNEYTVSFSLLMGNGSYIVSDDYDLNETFSFDTLSTELNVPTLTYLTNEYKRCFENLNPNLMMLSKTQPWVCPWVLKNGYDIRENPYRLNCNPVFGQYSFTPDITNYEPEPNHYNQEWLYIMQSQSILNENLGNKDLNQRRIWSYIGESISDMTYGPYDDTSISKQELFEQRLKSTTENWFDVYFKRDNTTLFYVEDNTTYHYDYHSTSDTKIKYSLLSNGSINTLSETFFRGVKLEFIMKSDWSEVIDNNLDTLKVKYGDDLNGYKFSAVCVPVKTSDIDISNDKIKVIRNDVFKTIILIQYIVIECEDEFIKYLNDTCELSINPNKIDLGLLTRYKFYNPAFWNENIYNTKISVKGKGEIANVIYGSNNTCEVIGKDTSFITDFDTGNDEKMILLIKNPGNQTNHAYEVLKIQSVKSDTSMICTYGQFSNYVTDIYSVVPVGQNNIINYVVTGSYVHKTNTYFIMNCGYNQFAQKLNKTTVASLMYAININQKTEIVYDHVDTNGICHSTDGTNKEYTFALRIIEPEENAKYEYMSLLFDGEYVNYGILPRYAAPMYRHTGKYTPLKNNVIYFTDPYIEDFSKNQNFANTVLNNIKQEMFNKSRHLNTCFDTNISDFGIIHDLAFHRTNENNTNIFKLTGDEKPIYPTSNRFSIGYRDIQTFNSNWDPWYFTRTLSNTLENDCHGTLSMKENKSFFGSKALSIPDSFLFETFSCSNDESLQPDILTSTIGSHIEMTLNVEQKLINTLCNNLHDLFYNFVDAQYSYGDKTTLDDDIETYIRFNLLKLYQLDKIELWIKEESTSNEPYFVFDALNMNNQQKEMNNLHISKIMNISSMPNNQFDKKIIINQKSGTKYTIGLDILITKK